MNRNAYMRVLAVLAGAMGIFAGGLAQGRPAPAKEPKVLFVVLDGIRDDELQGRAKDDEGKRVATADLFPQFAKLKRQGTYLPNMRISNPAGISLPAYSDLFAGRRQEKITTNNPPTEDLKSRTPTLVQIVKKGLKLSSDGVAVFSPWEPVCTVAMTAAGGEDNEFFRSCGWEPGRYFKPEPYPGLRADMDTFIEVMREIPKRHPRFIFLHLIDADVEGHFHDSVMQKTGVYYGIFNYHKAIRENDYYLGRVWSMLQDDPYYKGSTYLVVTTDHGRDNVPDADQWANHGHCVKYGSKKLCSGCQHVFGLVFGPGVPARVVDKPYTHLDFAPTIAKIFGLEMPDATGQVIKEALPRLSR